MGKRQRLGSDACEPVGPASCPAGFEREPPGWGCREIVPPAPCSDATRGTPGSKICQAVGDCTAPFPPRNATLFVDASGPADATHFRTLSAALAVATAGAVIAIDAGLYDEGVSVRVPLTIVGRCPERVRFRGDGTGDGIVVYGARGVRLKGLGIEGFAVGLGAVNAAEVVADELLLSGNTETGVRVASTGAGRAGTLVLTRSAIRGPLPAGAGPTAGAAQVAAGGVLRIEESEIFTPGFGTSLVAVGFAAQTPSVLRLLRTLVRGAGVAAQDPDGATRAVAGGRVEAVESVFLGQSSEALVSQDAGSVIVLERSVVSGTLLDRNFVGTGVSVSSGGRAEVVASTLKGVAGTALMVVTTTSTALVRESAILGPAIPCAAAARCPALGVVTEGQVVVEGSVVSDRERAGLGAEGALAKLQASRSLVRRTHASAAEGLGAGAQDGGRLELQDCAVEENEDQGVGARGPAAVVTLDGVVVRDTRDKGHKGAAVLVTQGAQLLATRCALLDNERCALQLVRSGTSFPGAAGPRATLHEVAISGTHPNPTTHATSGAVLVGVGARLSLASSAISDTEGGAALYISGPGAQASLEAVTVSGLSIPDEAQAALGVGVAVITQAVLTMTSTVVRDVPLTGVIVDVGARLQASRSAISDVRPWSQGDQSFGLYAGEGAVADLAECDVSSCQVGLFFNGAGGKVRVGLVRRNKVGVHAQGGTRLTVGTTDDEIAPRELRVDTETIFDGNDTRTGTGNLPVPKAPSF